MSFHLIFNHSDAKNLFHLNSYANRSLFILHHAISFSIPFKFIAVQSGTCFAAFLLSCFFKHKFEDCSAEMMDQTTMRLWCFCLFKFVFMLTHVLKKWSENLLTALKQIKIRWCCRWKRSENEHHQFLHVVGEIISIGKGPWHQQSFA